MHGGNEFCSDLTDTETYWRNISSWIQGKYSLKLIDGEYPSQLKRDKYRWQSKIETRIDFSPDGGQIEKQVRTYDNVYSSWLKSKLKSIKKTQRSQWLVNEYQGLITDTVEPVFEVSGVESMEDNVVIASKASYKPFLDTDKELDYFENDAWVRGDIKDSYISNKHYGAYVDGFKTDSIYVIDSQNIWAFTVKPSNLSLEHKFGSLKRETHIKNKYQLEIKTELKLPSMYIPASEVKKYNQFLDALKKESGIRFYGKPLNPNP